MVFTPILTARKRCSPFAANTKKDAIGIMKDLQGRAASIKVAECDNGVILDAEALSIGPDRA